MAQKDTNFKLTNSEIKTLKNLINKMEKYESEKMIHNKLAFKTLQILELILIGNYN